MYCLSMVLTVARSVLPVNGILTVSGSVLTVNGIDGS